METRKLPLKKIIRRTILTLLVLALLFLIGQIAVTMLRAKYTRVFTGYTATVGTISDTLSFTGKMEAINAAAVIADGNTDVSEVYVSEGQKVAKKDKLIRLMDGTTYFADFSGTINQIHVKKGDHVTKGSELLSMADFSRMRLSVDVDEYKIGRMYVGKECMVTMTASGVSFPAVITQIDHANATGTRIVNYTVCLDVEPGEGCYPGMQATVDFTDIEAENVVILRKSAVSFDDSNSAYVWKMNENNEPEKCNVTIGAHNDDYVEIVSGVTAKETIYQEENKSALSGLAAMMSAYRSNYSRGNNRQNRSGSGNNWNGGNNQNRQQNNR